MTQSYQAEASSVRDATPRDMKTSHGGSGTWQHIFVAVAALLSISVHLTLRFSAKTRAPIPDLPLLAALVLGGIPLVYELLRKLCRREFGSDLLAGISIITSVLLGEYLAGVIVILMLSGGEALEQFAVGKASSVLGALARRMPTIAHQRNATDVRDLPVQEVKIGDTLLVYPHEICPVDGTVADGHSVMDESYLTGEPFTMSKAPGSPVISGAINGAGLLTITAAKTASDSRYAKIMEVIRESEQTRPRLRRLADKLGAIYTPVAVIVALAAWIYTGDAIRFLAVLVIATPCPLLIAIPVSIIGSISLAARRGIIVRNPVALEQVNQCRTAIFDKTGTLTSGEPRLTQMHVTPEWPADSVLAMAASLEQYSKHPLARAIVAEALSRGLKLRDAAEVTEPPGKGLTGIVADHRVELTSRKRAADQTEAPLPPVTSGLECFVLIDGRYAATFTFRDVPRVEGKSFVTHLRPKHGFDRIMIVSGDRDSEVRYLAAQVGVSEVHAGKQPEEKLEIVRQETARAKTLYVGDGINDAPAMMAATVGMALGRNSDVTIEAADVVAMESSLKKIDEFMHISHRMKSIALQSALTGMFLSIGGMLFAAAGYLTPVAGAIGQEIIDIAAIANALRAALPPKILSDMGKTFDAPRAEVRS
jgi:heavy metal translocating P-type ATPase